MLKKITKWVTILVLAIVSFECIRALPLLFPHPFFAHKTSIDEFKLFADSPIDSTTLSQVHDAIQRVKRSEIYTVSSRHRIFLCFNEKKYAFFSSLAGKNKYSQGINIEPTGNVFISKSFINEIRNRYGPAFEGSFLEGSIVHIIAHEILHTVITDKVGYWPSRKLPHWLKEGYAEYGAAQSDKNSTLAQQLWLETKRFYAIDQRSLSAIRYQYLRSKLLIKYLIDIEERSVETVLTTSFNESEVIASLNRWYQAHSASLTLPPPTDVSR